MSTELDHLLPASFRLEENQMGWKAFSKALLNASRSGVFAVDKTGTIIISNQIVQKNFGLFPGTQLKTTMPDFWPLVESTLKDREYRRGISIQSEKASFIARISPISWKDNLIGVLCIYDDRTELEKITHKMFSFQQLSRELYGIINSSNDGLWICDGQANVIRINPASELINNVRADDVVGRNMQDLVNEGFVNRSVTLEVIKSGKKVNLLQTTKDGSKLVLTGNPVFDGEGKLIRVVVNERDITEIDSLRRELEEQESIKDGFRNQMLEMQLAELDSTRIIARSPSIAKVLGQAMKVAQVDSTVLILGESGTGKELIADLIHKYSNRCDRPLIKINCGAIPESLVESELFGYEKGAFTGAHAGGKPGHLELAHGGILLLDEIGELALSAQVKLLRFLEDGNVVRIGGTTGRHLDVRILAATNRHLKDMVDGGEFRRDLYYRLHVIPLRIPPLRKRKECILPLIHHFIDHFKTKLGIKKQIRFSSKAIDALLTYSYPGNVRELMNVCERLVVMTEGEWIDIEDLPGAITTPSATDHLRRSIRHDDLTLQQLINAVEREALATAMKQHGTQARAAIALGINQSTIARKLKKYGLN